jgi:hypothetical protein
MSMPRWFINFLGCLFDEKNKNEYFGCFYENPYPLYQWSIFSNVDPLLDARKVSVNIWWLPASYFKTKGGFLQVVSWSKSPLQIL